MLTSGVEISKLNDEEFELVKKIFFRNFDRFNGTTMHENFANRLEQILSMDIRDDDVWVCSFPKAGTTWTQEMVWCIANDLNFVKAKIPLTERFIFLDTCFILGEEHFTKLPEAKTIESLLKADENATATRRPIFIKTHLPYDLLPKKLRDGSTKAKIVCVSRNPRDACISSFYHRKMMGIFKGDLETYADMFLRGLVTFGPYWKHLFSYWNEKDSKNLVFIKFEDMKENLPQVINKVAKLFGKKFNTDEIGALCDHLSFERMKNNPAVNSDTLTDLVTTMHSTKYSGSFIRKGAVDQWKSELSQPLIDRFERWEEEHLKELNLTYISL